MAAGLGFGAFLVALTGPIVKRALTALGVGVVSYAALDAALSSALTAAKGAWGGLAGDAAALVAMAGVNTAASILAGALTARVAMVALKRLELLR